MDKKMLKEYIESAKRAKIIDGYDHCVVWDNDFESLVVVRQCCVFGCKVLYSTKIQK